MNRFKEQLVHHKIHLQREQLITLQLNVGRKCNQACRHCHVDAGPNRNEMINETVAQTVCEWITAHTPQIVDITGGAPELSQHFPQLVETSCKAGCEVIDRCNLTIFEEDSFGWLPDYLAAHRVTIIASLPCYEPENVTKQRGSGVFDKCIRSLQRLNSLGYGNSLPLHLVYNPIGPTLPPPQTKLEAKYKKSLRDEFGIIFNHLFTITNQPIARFANDLRQQGRWNEYLELLATNFNPAATDRLMCRSTLSVGYKSEVFDCDFNQMLGMHMENDTQLHLRDITPANLIGRTILTGDHCLACTAGSGSSCAGTLI